MSKNKINKRKIETDPIYNSILATQIINKILKKGKKTIARNIFYKCMENIKEVTKKDPLEILEKAITNITPKVELKSKRLGGSNISIPIEIKQKRAISVALKILIKSSRERMGRSFFMKLSSEIVDSSNNIGSSIKKKEEIHKKANANKAFFNLKEKKIN